MAYTTPIPSPALTMVPMNARSVESASAASAGTGCGDFSEADRLAGQDAFVAFQAGDLDQSHVGGYGFAQRQPDDVAGDQIGDVDLDEVPVAAHHRGVAHPRMQRRGRPFGAVLVDEAQADAGQPG